jgi:hypothetical protein
VAALVKTSLVDIWVSRRPRGGAFEDYARLTIRDLDLQLDAQNDLAELRLRQERRLGEMLAEMEMNAGQLRRGGTMSQRDEVPTLVDLGIARKQSSRWQRAASLPVDVFEGHVSATREARSARSRRATCAPAPSGNAMSMS